MSVKVSSKYQVVMPESVRRALNLKPGLEVEVIAKGGVAYTVPVQPIEELASSLKNKMKPGDTKSVREKADRKI